MIDALMLAAGAAGGALAVYLLAWRVPQRDDDHGGARAPLYAADGHRACTRRAIRAGHYDAEVCDRAMRLGYRPRERAQRVPVIPAARVSAGEVAHPACRNDGGHTDGSCPCMHSADGRLYDDGERWQHA